LTDSSSLRSACTYASAGKAKTASTVGGLLTTYSYDRAQRLTSLINAVGSTTISEHDYTLDPEGNRTAQAEFVSGISAPNTLDQFSYGYDGLERLTSVGGALTEGFMLDAASNISARTGPSATYTYDTANRLTSDGAQSFSWSDADRLTARGSDAFAYDPLDRLVSSTVASVTRSYAYNGDGLLQSRTQGSTTSFLWEPATAPSRLLLLGSDKLVYGLGPLYVVKADNSTLTFARDGQKPIRAEFNSGGGVSASFRYRAYGEIATSYGATIPSYLGYAGQLRDPSGLYYMRARWFDTATGRFMTRDPLDQATSTAFGYASANPVGFYDPTGFAQTPFGPSDCLCLVAAAPSAAAPTDSDDGACEKFGPGIFGCNLIALTEPITYERPRSVIRVIAIVAGPVFAEAEDLTEEDAADDGGSGSAGAAPPFGPGASNRKFSPSEKHPELTPEIAESALAESLRVSQNSARRVGIDYGSSRFIVFDETHPG